MNFLAFVPSPNYLKAGFNSINFSKRGTSKFCFNGSNLRRWMTNGFKLKIEESLGLKNCFFVGHDNRHKCLKTKFRRLGYVKI